MQGPTKEARAAAEAKAASYATQYEQDAYRAGYSQGHGIACHNVPTLGERIWVESLGRVTVDAENIREVHADLCCEAESNSRQYSPWEFTAYGINSLDDTEGEGATDAAWEAYEQGVADAIVADIATYTDEDYGIVADATEED